MDRGIGGCTIELSWGSCVKVMCRSTTAERLRLIKNIGMIERYSLPRVVQGLDSNLVAKAEIGHSRWIAAKRY